jgi:hypothetical protein
MSTIKGLKAKILEAANAAFQNKTFIKFDGMFLFLFSSPIYMLKVISEVQEALNVVVDGQETSLKVQLAIKDSIDELAKSTKPKSREGMVYLEADLTFSLTDTQQIGRSKSSTSIRRILTRCPILLRHSNIIGS